MPAATASRRIAYSAVAIEVYVSLPREAEAWGGGPAVLFGRLIRGKLPHRLRDLVRVRHKELLLRAVERHGRDVRGRDADHRAVEVVEGLLRDDRRDLGAKTPAQVVLVHDHALARLADRLEDRFPAHGCQGPQVGVLHADALRLQLGMRIEAVMRQQPPGEAA